MALVRLAVCLLLIVAAAGCATSGAVPKPFPGAGRPGQEVPSPVPGPERFDPEAVVATALGQQGVPYRNGGSDPGGFDCSGLVQYAFAQHGVALPRETREQFDMGESVRLAGIQPGDLLFFRTSGDGPSHVGMAIGGDQFVHAPSTGGVVRVERFSAPYWARRLVAIKRVR